MVGAAQDRIEAIREAAWDLQDEAVEFLRELIRIPSFSGREGPVVEHCRQSMAQFGFDEVKVDPFGNVLGRIGSGSKTLAFDAHLDTVEVGDPRLWLVDPFGAELINGVIYGRGASDQKAGMAALVYAGVLLRKLRILGDASWWFVGSVLEEDCDGLCWQYILREGVLKPDLVVITEPTELQVYRGHRGRMEMEVMMRGVSCHGSAPERGVNAVYRMASVLRGIEAMQGGLGDDPFLGPGSVAVSEIRSTSPSLCAVADSCAIHLDRRLSAGETEAAAVAEVESVLRAAEEADAPGTERAGHGSVTVPEFRRASHTGLVYPTRQYFPPWALPADHPYVEMALAARGGAMGERGAAGKWAFSTNGTATMGMHGVPTIGFGPASERHAHAPDDQCPADHLGQAIAFYAVLAAMFAGEL